MVAHSRSSGSSAATKWATTWHAGIMTSMLLFRFSFQCPVLLTGTMGAFIRIREPIPSKRMLFDIGIAGPIAGFLVAVPALFSGWRCRTSCARSNQRAPLRARRAAAVQAFSTVLWGTPPDGYSLNLHPVAFAAWFGLLATALNLFPIGQLDGGHISYAVLGSNSRHVTRAMIGVALVLTYFYRSWLVWTIVMLLMLRMFGWRHPPTMDEHACARSHSQAFRRLRRDYVRALLYTRSHRADRAHSQTAARHLDGHGRERLCGKSLKATRCEYTLNRKGHEEHKDLLCDLALCGC